MTPAGDQGSSQCDCSFAACSGRVAVAGRAPAGAHRDATAYRLVRFAKGQSKDEVARRYLAGHDGGEQLLFAGVA